MKKNPTAPDGLIDYTIAPHLHLVGSGQCIVDGLRGIMEYSKDRIRINLGSYSILIIGCGLYINRFSHQGAIIEGNIISLEFCNNE